MSVTIVVGAQGGDEGKGKFVDFLSSNYDLVIRYSGGDNAGHTIVNDMGIFHLHLVPSGIFNYKADNLIGTGMVVNPDSLRDEIKNLNTRGVCTEKLRVSGKAHILMPYHIAIDCANEKKHSIIDTTKRGIGPAYADRAYRDGLRFEDLLDVQGLHQKLSRALSRVNAILAYYGEPFFDLELLESKCIEWRSIYKDIIVEPISFIHDYLKAGRSILFEGQLGILRDLDLGTYPYVTSSYPSAAYACVSAGISVHEVNSIIGIARAYPIFAGNGPFPTEMDAETAQCLRGTGEKIDDEYGVTTNRPRRIGWMDLPLLKYSSLINGYTEIALSKLDKFDQFESIKVCVAYQLNGKEIDYIPTTRELDQVKPVYITLQGWKSNTSNVRRVNDFPRKALEYIKVIENSIHIPVKYIGVGPARHEIAIL